jgi:hypothetical protein
MYLLKNQFRLSSLLTISCLSKCYKTYYPKLVSIFNKFQRFIMLKYEQFRINSFAFIKIKVVI